MPFAPPLQKISVVIIAQDEAERIGPAIRSCAPFADEVLLVDGGSRDATVAIAQELGCRVHVNPWPGYARQRNLGAAAAAHDWIFFLDADEVVDAQLAESLARWKERPAEVRELYSVCRIGDFLGLWLDHHGQACIRLYNRTFHAIVDTPVHEAIDPGGCPVHPLEGTLWHYGFRSIADHIERFNRYTTLEAEKARLEGRGFSLFRLLAKPIARFPQQYILHGLYKKGVPGFCVAVLWMFYDAFKELKIYEMRREVRERAQTHAASAGRPGPARLERSAG